MRKTSCKILRAGVIYISAIPIYLGSPAPSDAADPLSSIASSSISPNTKSSNSTNNYSEPEMKSEIANLIGSVIPLLNNEKIYVKNSRSINLTIVQKSFPDFVISLDVDNDQYIQIRLKLKNVTKGIPCFANAVIGLTRDGKESLFDTVIPPGGCLAFDDHMLSAEYGPPTYSQSGPPPSIGLGHDVGLPNTLSLLSYQYKGAKNRIINIMIWADLKNKRLYEVRLEKKEK